MRPQSTAAGPDEGGWNWRWALGFAVGAAAVVLSLLPALRRSGAPIIQVAMMDAAGPLRGDHLLQGTTELSAPYRVKPTVGLSQELFRHRQARFPHLGLGQHYELVDDFARILDLEGL